MFIVFKVLFVNETIVETLAVNSVSVKRYVRIAVTRYT